MAGRAVVALRFEVVGYDVGLWCRECALPSAVRLTLAVSSPGTASLSTVRRCRECGGDQVED